MNPFNKNVLQNLRRIHIRTKYLVEGILSGAYHSAFKGQGIEFDEVREYQSGDEIRTIDWNVTARMNKPYVKRFHEERDLTILLAVDISSSQNFGSGRQTKNELVAELGAVLALSAVENDDKVGLALFTTSVEKYIPPKKGIKHVLSVTRELLLFSPKEKGTDLSAVLTFLGNVHKRFAVCFLISDFLCPLPTTSLAIAAKRYDLIALHVMDPLELSLPKLSVATMGDLESMQTGNVDTTSHMVRQLFDEDANNFAGKIKDEMQKIGAGYIPIFTDKPYVNALRRYFLQKNYGRMPTK